MNANIDRIPFEALIFALLILPARTCEYVIFVVPFRFNQLGLFFFQDLMGKLIQELCQPEDLNKLSHHLKQTLTIGQSMSTVYRFMVSTDKYVQVRSKSKLFKSSNPSTESDFIMATHSIIGLVHNRVTVLHIVASAPGPTFIFFFVLVQG